MKLNQQVKRRLALLAAALLLLAAVAAAGLYFAPSLLRVDSQATHADCLVVLGGENWTRVPLAKQLFLAGTAPTVLLTGKGDCGQNKLWLVEGGVPRTAILTEQNSTSTAENARFSVPILRAHGCTNVILVTSWYHSRRALNCFQHYAPDLKFYSCPTLNDQKSRWPNKYQRGRIVQEYIKLLGYWPLHGIPPW